MKLQFVHFPERDVWRIARKEHLPFRLWIPRWVWVTKHDIQHGVSLNYTGFTEKREVVAEFKTKADALEFVKIKYLTTKVVTETKNEKWVIESEITIK